MKWGRGKTPGNPFPSSLFSQLNFPYFFSNHDSKTQHVVTNAQRDVKTSHACSNPQNHTSVPTRFPSDGLTNRHLVCIFVLAPCPVDDVCVSSSIVAVELTFSG